MRVETDKKKKVLDDIADALLEYDQEIHISFIPGALAVAGEMSIL